MVAYYRPGTLDAPLLDCKAGAPMRDRYTETVAIQDLLREALIHEPSDIHVATGHPVLLEIHGELYRITDHATEWPEFENLARVLRDKEGATTMLSQGQDYDDAFTMVASDGARRRLRVSMTAITSLRAKQAGHIVMRPLVDVPPRVQDLKIPQELLDRCFPKNGGVYVIGPTGSGKTTLFGSLFRYASETGCSAHGHLACYEAPPEFDLESLSSKYLLISQTAIGVPWGLPTFAAGIRNSLRRHPCMVMIGEVRDYETVAAIVEASLTGHPVYGTTHATSPAVAFQRLITRYPAEQQRAGLYDLIMTTEVIIAQSLIRARSGGRVAIREWIAFDDVMRNKLLALNDPGAVVVAIKEMVAKNGFTFLNDAKILHAKGEIDDRMMADVARQYSA